MIKKTGQPGCEYAAGFFDEKLQRKRLKLYGYICYNVGKEN